MAGQIPHRGQPAARGEVADGHHRGELSPDLFEQGDSGPGARRMTRRRARPAWSEKSTRAGERINCLLYWYEKANDPGSGRIVGIRIRCRAFLCH